MKGHRSERVFMLIWPTHDCIHLESEHYSLFLYKLLENFLDYQSQGLAFVFFTYLKIIYMKKLWPNG